MNLYENLALKTADALCEDKESERYDKIKYGSQAFYIGVLKSILALLITVLVFPHLLPTLLFFIAISALLSSSSFGAHMPNTILCTLEGLLKYLGGSYLATKVIFPFWLSSGLFLISAVVFYLYAPAATKKRPIAKKTIMPLKSRSLFKLMLVIIISYLPTLPFAPWIGNVIVLAAISQSIFLLPVWNRTRNKNAVE